VNEGFVNYYLYLAGFYYEKYAILYATLDIKKVWFSSKYKWLIIIIKPANHNNSK